MEIKTFLNTTQEEVKSRTFNIFIGISLGNRKFTKELIQKYLLWSLQYTKEKIVIIIADKSQAINFEQRNKYPEKRALDVAIRQGKEVENQLISIINSFLPSQREKIEIIHWEELEKTKGFRQRQKILKEEFKENKKFHDLILEIIKENTKLTSLNADLEKLALY